MSKNTYIFVDIYNIIIISVSRLIALKKIINSPLVTRKYPSIDKIDIGYYEDSNDDLSDTDRLLMYKIYLNTKDWEIKLLPADFVDFFLTPLSEYLGFSQNYLHFYEIYNVDGVKILDYKSNNLD